MQPHARTGWKVAAVSALLVVGLAAPVGAWHWAKWGWRDRHYNYPPKPHGYREIVDEFGNPCNERAKANAAYWRASDNGQWYAVRFHRRLGGSVSSNLDNDVYGHIRNQHLDPYVKSGIWGYNCRFIAGTHVYSTHAWGIAVDVSSAHEPFGTCWSGTNNHHAGIWRNHRWNWGLDFCDPMHFQYAADY